MTRDFAPISTLGSFDLGRFTPAASRFADLRALVAFTKANPGKLNVGTISISSTQHLAAKLFETMAGIDALVVPYKGSPAVSTALPTGEIDVAFEIVSPMLPHVAAGAVKALAASARRHAAGAASLARQRHQALGRRDPRRQDRAGVSRVFRRRRRLRATGFSGRS